LQNPGKEYLNYKNNLFFIKFKKVLVQIAKKERNVLGAIQMICVKGLPSPKKFKRPNLAISKRPNAQRQNKAK